MFAPKSRQLFRSSAPRPRNAGSVRQQSAFTLVELLVVIAIISLLMAILLPSFGRAREVAKRVSCASNVRQLSIAWSLYPVDHQGGIVHGMPRNKNAVKAGVPVGEAAFVLPGGGPEPIRKGALFPYTNQSVDVYQCPSEDGGRKQGIFAQSSRSYSITGSMYGETWDYPNEPRHASKKTHIKQPSKQLVWMEENDHRGSHGGWNVGSWLLGDRAPYGWIRGKYRWVDYVSVFHDDIDNMGYADGHMDYYKWKDEDTIAASEDQSFFLNDPGNVDWEFLDTIYDPGL